MATANPFSITTPTQQQTPSANPWAGGPGSQSSLIDPNAIPQISAPQMGESPELTAMLAGKGFSPGILAMMKATAVQGAAGAGMQEMGQMKRQLGQNGLAFNSPAAAAYEGDVARRTGQAETAGLNDVATKDAQLSEDQKKYGLGLQTDIGQSNFNRAQQAAMYNASNIFGGLQNNQGVRLTTQQSVANQQ